MSTAIQTLIASFQEFANLRAPLVLTVRVAPDQLYMATRVVGALTKDDERNVMLFAHPAEGETASEYFAAWVDAINEEFEGARPDFEKVKERFFELPPDVLPSVPKRPAFDQRTEPAAAFVAWIERVAEISRDLAEGVVLVTYADDELEAEVREGLKRLGRMLGSGRVKLIVLDASTTPLFAEGTTASSRVRVGSLLSVDADAMARFRDFVRSDEDRVLVASGGSNLGIALSMVPEGASITITSPYRGRAAFEDAVWADLGASFGARRPNGRRPTADDLARELERVREERSIETLVVGVDARPSITPQFLAAWVKEVAHALASPRTKIVLVEDNAAPVAPHLAADLTAFRTTSFQFGPGEIEQMVTSAAKQPDAPRQERFNAFIALAGYASGRSQHQEAFAHITEAAKLAKDAEERARVAGQEGNAWYRAKDFDKSAQAFQRGLDEATAQGSGATEATVADLTAGLAKCALRKGEYEDAAALYEAAANLLRHAGAMLYALGYDGWRGEALRRMGRLEDADRVWSSAAETARKLGADFEHVVPDFLAELAVRRLRLAEQRGDGHLAQELRRELSVFDEHPPVAAEP
ncbi:MAG: hypothetical protein HOW73_41045 [Polyangiaceae bacterium]|nr:hypothetical protein [Polyangiaceae bacterium]